MIMKHKTLVQITATAGVVSTLCLLAYFLALHDIFRDYASASVIRENISNPPPLPAWTACALEWKIVGICFWPMLVFHVVFLIGLLTGRNRSEKQGAEPGLPGFREPAAGFSQPPG
jgi:hypothetical protein